MFLASTVTTISSKGDNRNGLAVKVVIGIVHYLILIIVDNEPSQLSVIALKIPS